MNNSLAASFDLLRVGTDSATGHASSDRLHDERDQIGSDEEHFESSPREPALLRRDVRDGEPRRPIQRRRVKRRRDNEAADLKGLGFSSLLADCLRTGTETRTDLHNIGGKVGGSVMRP